MSFFSSKLEKLTIKSYKDKTRTGQPKTFEVKFNPESYSRQCINVFDKKQAINTTGREAKYSMTAPEKMSLKLILDDTGADEYQSLFNLFGSGDDDVSDQVEEFLKLTYVMDGNIHEPRFLKLMWGNLVFNCRLASVQVNYTLFDQSGVPLRAELDTEFVGDVETKERLKKENKNSPDLTHYRIVGGHDRLPLMCEAIYGAPDYYLLVAKANNLDDFRDLEPGQEIYFPPIEK